MGSRLFLVCELRGGRQVDGGGTLPTRRRPRFDLNKEAQRHREFKTFRQKWRQLAVFSVSLCLFVQSFSTSTILETLI